MTTMFQGSSPMAQYSKKQIVLNLGGKADMLGLGVFDGHSGAEASKYVAANLWDQVSKRILVDQYICHAL